MLIDTHYIPSSVSDTQSKKKKNKGVTVPALKTVIV